LDKQNTASSKKRCFEFRQLVFFARMGTMASMDTVAPPAGLTAALKRTPVQQVRYFESIGSTMDAAADWLNVGLDQPALVVANQQTSGRGRLQRAWISTPDAALTFSLILPLLSGEETRMPLFSPAAGLALALALEQEFNLKPVIKWPNDVLLNDAKVCGVLAEAHWPATGAPYAVLGVGVNIGVRSIPPETRFPATALELSVGEPVDRWQVLAAWLTAFTELRSWIGQKHFLDAWRSRLAYLGKAVRLETPTGVINGKLIGISPQGDLQLELSQGQQAQFTAGDLSLRPAQIPQ
jgi:BirA family biotin operon repressor/biotin-[acetyl-CoA-carboxylase] ligase